MIKPMKHSFDKFMSVICVVFSLTATACYAKQQLSENHAAKNKQSISEQQQWREVTLENMVVMTLPHGQVVFELAPQFSPEHVKQFIRLTKKGHYDGNKFYRVIDGFVAQAGPDNGSFADRMTPKLTLEGDWKVDKNWPFTLVQNNDLFAEKTGFKDGFAIGYNASEQKAWLTHCPGVIAMARGNDANSASSHFYIPIGQAPRYLDRIMTVFGRVIYGMAHIQAITRTAIIEGDKPINPSQFTPIVSMKMMSDLAEKDQFHFEIERTESTFFIEKLQKRLQRKHPFFFQKPPKVLDVCQTPVVTRKIH